MNTIPCPADEYNLPKPAIKFLNRWYAGLVNRDEFYTIDEINLLAKEVIDDHNYAAKRGEWFNPRSSYRNEQVLFASRLPAEEYVSMSWFAEARSVTVERKHAPIFALDG